MSGPSLETIFRDVMAARTLPYEPKYPDACRANQYTIYVVNILLMRHRNIDPNTYVRSLESRDPEGYERIRMFERWMLLNDFLRDYIKETNGQRCLSHSV